MATTPPLQPLNSGLDRRGAATMGFYAVHRLHSETAVGRVNARPFHGPGVAKSLLLRSQEGHVKLSSNWTKIILALIALLAGLGAWKFSSVTYTTGGNHSPIV